MTRGLRWTEEELKAFENKRVVQIDEHYSKYRNKKQLVDGIEFDSKKEAHRYKELKALEAGNVIMNLKVHPVFPIVIKETRICDVELDFAYTLPASGVRIYEDVKSAGTNTPLSKLKRKLVALLHNIKVEVLK